MARIAALLSDVTLACAACDLPKASEDTGTAAFDMDTAAFEIALMERAFGVLLPVVLRLVGVSKLQFRTDLDTFVGHLVAQGP